MLNQQYRVKYSRHFRIQNRSAGSVKRRMILVTWSVANVTPAKTPPVKTAPAKTAPVKTAPVKTAPVKTAPAKTAESRKPQHQHKVCR